MNTIIVPTDFTDNAIAGMQYAAAFANEMKAQKIILYSTYSAPTVATGTGDVSFSFIETDGLKQMNDEQLARGKAEVSALVQQAEVEARSDYGVLESRIDELVKESGADIIIIGIEKMGAIEEALTGSNAMSILKHVQIPVLMVPPDAGWQPLRNIAWACDYKSLDKAPVWSLKPLLKETGATLHVIHNEPEQKEADYTKEQQQIKEWFADTQITFAQLHNKDLNEAVNSYVAEHHIDLLIAVPHKHGWLEGLFASSHSKQLAFEAHVPVVCVQGV